MKTIIERGASWTLEETKLLLALWGQDLDQRQTTNMKRTKEVYEKISEKFIQSGYERTADQVRTRVFNMIAEYRRILKDPTPDRIKKCIFFEALHKIYAAKHMDDVKAAIDDYEPEHPYSPFSNTAPSTSTSAPNASATTNSNSTDATSSNSEQSRSSVPPVSTSTTGNSLAPTSASSASHKHHQSLLLPHATTSAASTSTSNSTPLSKITTSGSNNTPSYININSTKLPIIRTNQLIGHSNGNESINLNGTTARLPTTAAITSHQLYQAPVNTFDVTSSALLIDRMFAHLSRESENMREWIALEKERLAIERSRRQQEAEREARRDRVLTETLMKYQDQWLSFLSKIDPRIIENSTDPPPELKIPPKESTESQTSTTQQGTTSHDSSLDV